MGHKDWRQWLDEDYEDNMKKVERIPHPRKTEEEKKKEGRKKGHISDQDMTE